jgi:hypothetical protein
MKVVMKSKIQLTNATKWAFRYGVYLAAYFLTLISAFGLLLGSAHADTLDVALAQWVQSLDENRDSRIARDELQRQMTLAKTNADTAQNAQPLQMFIYGFSMMDSNGDGKLSASEISAGINARFENADRNRNGKLTTNEASSGMPMVARNWREIDANVRGEVTLQQVRDYMAMMMLRMLQK